MTYTDIIGDIFTAPDHYYFVHCISSDFVMGAGIAPQFTARFNTKYNLLKNYPNYSERFKYGDKADCILDGRVFNLVTKHLVWEKPTMESITKAVKLLREQCLSDGITNLAMPEIGCGIDGLNWSEVSQMIKFVFKDTNINIVVYHLNTKNLN